jgi:hypothetical protein
MCGINGGIGTAQGNGCVLIRGIAVQYCVEEPGKVSRQMYELGTSAVEGRNKIFGRRNVGTTVRGRNKIFGRRNVETTVPGRNKIFGRRNVGTTQIPRISGTAQGRTQQVANHETL